MSENKNEWKRRRVKGGRERTNVCEGERVRKRETTSVREEE